MTTLLDLTMRRRQLRFQLSSRPVNLHGKWPSFCKLSGRYWRLIWPPYRPHALHSNWCLKTRPFSVQRSGQINRQFTAHHHRAAGHPRPADPAREAAPPTRELIDPGQVEMLMRLLPSNGWTAGLFGRRDRALLTLAAHTTIPYRQLPRLTVGQLYVAGGVATITDHNGTPHVVVEAAADPVLCGPCTLVRWRRVLDTEVQHLSVKKLLRDAEVVTVAGHHPCHAPKPIDDKTLDAPLFPPINQWGHLPCNCSNYLAGSVHAIWRSNRSFVRGSNFG